MLEDLIRLNRVLKSVDDAQNAIRRVENDAKKAGMDISSLRRAMRELDDTEFAISRAIRNLRFVTMREELRRAEGSR